MNSTAKPFNDVRVRKALTLGIDRHTMSKVLYPLTAHDQPIAAPAPVRAAWRTITRHIDSTVAATRLGRAA